MVTFSIALMCFCFVISNHTTRITVGTTSALVVALTILCLWIAWGSSNAWTVWLDGILPSFVPAPPYDRIFHGRVERLRSFVLGVVESLRNRPASRSLDSTGDIQMSTITQGGGAGV
jgi:hypothetical protein